MIGWYKIAFMIAFAVANNWYFMLDYQPSNTFPNRSFI
ncbi:hypothetical protein SSU98_1528 [Streptococcus suis 98HAH33]|nr:hypothetical protein SSU05_1517 [Streptococcus suis 05ZYH33]ABP92686.1 hypothetical protein SSU98_1528 [Streptococcus suis 98HAH33]